MLILTALICACIVFLYYKLRLPLQYWKDRNTPHPTPSIIIGNLGPVLFRKESYTQQLQKTCAEYKGFRYFGLYHFSKPCLVILDKELIKQIFIKNFEHFTDHFDFLPKDVDTFWKKGLFGREGEDWQAMRSTISPAFTSKKMKAMFYLVAECSERFVNHFREKNTTVTIEMMDAFTKCNNDVIASCTFGIHCDTLENEKNEFYLMGKEAFSFSGLKGIKFFGNAISPTLSRLLRVKMFSNKIRDFFIRITQETMAYREKTGLHRPDVLHLLMEAQKGRLTYEEDNDQLGSSFSGIEKQYHDKKNNFNKFSISDEDIASQALIFFFGSYDTVSIVLSHIVYELVANGDVQNKLIKEVDYTLNDCNGKITYEALFKMKYLDMVVSETMRLWPPPPFLSRVCVKPFVIEPILPNETRLLIEPGTEVMVSVNTSHRNPEYFPNPEKFNPERFNDENKENIEACTYFPFGIGPRHCIG
ncbi:hypothetical protein FQR65_LT08282 [Abscondita terminalis]|nr:hypothetical protein FQR65_LT08282 [Abscondita terminalis]